MDSIWTLLQAHKEWVGWVAATLTCVCFVPQVLLTIKTRDTKAISMPMYVVFTLGVFGWFLYGLAMDSWPMIVLDGLTTLLAIVILVLKRRHG